MRTESTVITDEVFPREAARSGDGGKPVSKPAKATKTTAIRTSPAKASGKAMAARSPRLKVAPDRESDRDEDDSLAVAFVVGGDDVWEETPEVLSGEAVDVEDDEDAALRTDRSETSPPGRLAQVREWVTSNRITAIIGGVAVALAVALILTLVTLGNSNSVDGARASAISAAKADAVRLAGYDYRHLNRDFGAVLANSTPSFRQRFNQAGDALETTLRQYHATAVAKVVSAGLVSASTSRAVVLVFLTQNVTNSAQKKTTSDRSQVQLTLVQSGGKWLIDQVSLL